MRYLLLTFLFAVAVPQTASAQLIESHGSDNQQDPEKLKKDAAALEEAVKQDPGDVKLHIKLGFIYAKLGKADDAQRAFEDAVRLDPKSAIAQYMLGLIYEKKGLRENAITAWKACLDNADTPHLRETARKHLHHLRAKQ